MDIVNCKTKKMLRMLLIMVLICNVVLAQNNIILKEIEVFAETNKNVIDLFINENDGTIIRAFSSKIFENNSTSETTYRDGLILSTGSEINFTDNERLVSIQGNNVITSKMNLTNHSTMITKYLLKNTELTKIFSEDINMLHPAIYPLSNGMLAITNEDEGYGSEIGILNKDIQLVKRYVPFEQGYTTIAFNGNSRQIVIMATNSQKPDEHKLTLFDLSGNLINEKTININGLRPSKIFFSNDYIVIYGLAINGSERNLKMYGIDMSGNILWNNNIILYEIDLVINDDKNVMLGITNSSGKEEVFNISCIGMDDGRTIWEKDISSIYKQNKIENSSELKNCGLRPSSLKMLFNQNGIGLTTGQLTWDGKRNSSSQFALGEFYYFDLEGNLISSIPHERESKIYEIFSSDNYFKIMDEQGYYTYEYIK